MASVLIAEDSAPFRSMLKAILSAAGHSVAETADGAACLEALGRGKFDLLLIDMMMPGMDGIETVRHLREVDRTLKVIAMSGGGEGFAASVALKMAEMYGVDRLLCKPFSNTDLLSAVQDLTSGA